MGVKTKGELRGAIAVVIGCMMSVCAAGCLVFAAPGSPEAAEGVLRRRLREDGMARAEIRLSSVDVPGYTLFDVSLSTGRRLDSYTRRLHYAVSGDDSVYSAAVPLESADAFGRLVSENRRWLDRDDGASYLAAIAMYFLDEGELIDVDDPVLTRSDADVSPPELVVGSAGVELSYCTVRYEMAMYLMRTVVVIPTEGGATVRYESL